MTHDDRQRQMRTSWEANAGAWTATVREGLIASRRAGTDAAILRACARVPARRVLDVGCGEGWLARALAATAGEVVGVDGSAALIEQARAAGGARFEVIDYETLAADPDAAAGPWDLVVCNYALLGDPLAPLLAALARRLAPGGRLLIQTVHPWTAFGDGPYVSGWRQVTFADFELDFPAAMPLYMRTLESWVAEIRRSGLVGASVEEPLDPATGKPLSVIFECHTSRDGDRLAR